MRFKPVRIFILIIFSNILLSSCSPGLITSQTPTLTTTLASTSTPTITSTPTLTPTSTITPTPTPPENPGYFDGVGEITEIELHNDKWYGIDTVGRAQIIFNAQTHEWEKYDRPIEVMYDLNYEDSYSLSPEILQDIEQTQISRLNTDGETLPWGLLQIEHPFEGYSFGHAYVSGYLLDVSSWSLGSDYVITNIVFEIPSRYNRQIINFIKLDGIWMFLDLYVIPDSGNVAEREQKPRTFHDFSTMLSNPDIIGSQIVLAFQINRLDSLPSGIQYEQDTYSKSDAALNSLIDAIGNGETYSSRSFTSAISRAWIPEAYFK